MDYADLRTGIHERLCADVDVGNRVFNGWVAPADTEKPFAIFSFIGELPSVNTHVGMWQQVEVVILGEESSYATIDPIADSVINALDENYIYTPDGRRIFLQYVRDARFDTYVSSHNAAAIRMKFILPTDFWK